MGWNDHVQVIETECLDCGQIDDWEYWDEVGRERYIGSVGALVGQDATKSHKCPHCGSTNGKVIDEEDE